MVTFAESALVPDQLIVWVAVGIVGGVLVGFVRKGGRSAIAGDLLAGLVGASLGGFLFGLVAASFWGGVAAALLGAGALIAFVRAAALVRAPGSFFTSEAETENEAARAANRMRLARNKTQPGAVLR